MLIGIYIHGKSDIPMEIHINRGIYGHICGKQGGISLNIDIFMHEQTHV